MQRRRVALGAAIVALAIGGCGGSSAPSLSAFKAGFASEKAAFRNLGLDLQQAITGAKAKTDAQLATEIGALATSASRQASQLSHLNPPAKYKAGLAKLVTGFRAVATDLQVIAAAAVKHDATTAKAATQTLLVDAARIKASDDAITKGLGLPAGG